jgi:hypothetical protein
VRPGLLRLMETLNDQPAFVLGRRTDVLAANRLARALLADFHAMPARERNLTRWILLDTAARVLYRDWRTIASEMVAILRLEAGRQPDDPRTTELVGELAVKSDDFNRWWLRQKVLERGGGSKHFRHPVVGELTVDYEALTLPADPDQTLFIYTARPAPRRRRCGCWPVGASTPRLAPIGSTSTALRPRATPPPTLRLPRLWHPTTPHRRPRDHRSSDTPLDPPARAGDRRVQRHRLGDRPRTRPRRPRPGGDRS